MSTPADGSAPPGPRLPRGRQVPFSSALGAVVFIAIMFSLSEPFRELEIVAGWGVVYAIECAVRSAGRWSKWLDLPEFRAAVIAGALLVLGVLADELGADRALRWTIYAGVYLVGGWAPLVTGLRDLRRRSIDADLLVVVAALCAAGVGKPVDGALLFVIFVSSRAFGALATRRTQESVRGLLDLTPELVNKVVDGDEELVPIEVLAPNDEFLVRPGERLGADGEVVSGVSEVHQASITGEPLPVRKSPGDEVFAGTVNGSGALRVRVTRPRPDSVLARIVATVQQASETKSRAQTRLELIERRYSLGLVAATLLLIVVPLGLGAELRPTLLRAMGFMIVASPCAFTLATMPALLAAIANAGRHGVLVKSAEIMTQLGDITTLAFDKTGTLTVGVPQVVDVASCNPQMWDADDLLRLAAGAERVSEHPIGQAIVAEAGVRGLALPTGGRFRSEPGVGVQAAVEEHLVTVSSPGLTATATGEGLPERFLDLERDGGTVVIVEVDGRRAGLIALRDVLRPEAVATLETLAEITADQPILLTGDGLGAASMIGSQVGIDDVRAQLLPDQKLTVIADLQSEGKKVAYVGDGLNDAPALASADVGVAMAHGADLSLETADVVILRAGLSSLPAAIELSRRAQRVVRQNLWLAGGVVVVLVVLDLIGTLPLPAAVGGHESSTLLVALNGLRLLRPAAWRVGRPVPAKNRIGRGALAWRSLVIGAALIGLTLLAIYSLGRFE